MNRQFIIEFNINDEDYPKEVERLRELKINPIEEHDAEIRADERKKVLDKLNAKVLKRLNNNRNAITQFNMDNEIFGKIYAYNNVMGFIQELRDTAD